MRILVNPTVEKKLSLLLDQYDWQSQALYFPTLSQGPFMALRSHMCGIIMQDVQSSPPVLILGLTDSATTSFS
jgi:hypothetical protein